MSTEATKSKILLIEDDVFLGNILVNYIKGKNIEAVRVKSAEDAAEALKTELPSLIMLDIYLPGMNGLEYLTKLRQDDRTKNIPVMVVSNTSQMKDREVATQNNASFFVKAMMTPQDIVAEIEKHLGKVS